MRTEQENLARGLVGTRANGVIRAKRATRATRVIRWTRARQASMATPVSRLPGATRTVRAALPAGDVMAIAVGVSTSDLYLASASGIVYRSTDQGETFATLACLIGSNFVALVPSGDGLTLYALDRTGEIFGSANGGASWTGRARWRFPTRSSSATTWARSTF